MNNLKVIRSRKQYNDYCDELERLSFLEETSMEIEERMDLLTVLIEKWDKEHSTMEEINPVEILKQLMEMHELSAIELSKKTEIDKTVLSKILNYKKGFSKDVIRVLSDYFKVNQEIFNKPYDLVGSNELVAKKFKSTLSPIKETANKSNEVQDYIKVIPSKRSISMSVTTYELISKEDKDRILYIPSLKIFGKASTKELAKEDLDSKVDKYLKKLLKLSQPKIAIELKRLGWKQSKYKTKAFSKSYIDKDGILRDFEIPVESKIVQRKPELFAV